MPKNQALEPCPALNLQSESGQVKRSLLRIKLMGVGLRDGFVAEGFVVAFCSCGLMP